MSSSYSWSKILLSLTVTGTLMVLAACGSPSCPTADAASKAKPANAAEPAKAPDAKKADKPAPKADPADKGEQLVANFNFKEWEKETPRRWIADPVGMAVKAAGAGPNSVFVELKPSGTDKYTTLRQRLSGNLAGKSLTVTLRAKAFEDKMLSAKLSFDTPAGPQTIVLDADGNGAWGSVTKTVNVPADAKADSGSLAVVLRPAAKKSAIVDYVTIKSK